MQKKVVLDNQEAIKVILKWVPGQIIIEGNEKEAIQANLGAEGVSLSLNGSKLSIHG